MQALLRNPKKALKKTQKYIRNNLNKLKMQLESHALMRLPSALTPLRKHPSGGGGGGGRQTDGAQKAAWPVGC
jgi:uncharacterized membrane protein